METVVRKILDEEKLKQRRGHEWLLEIIPQVINEGHVIDCFRTKYLALRAKNQFNG